MFIVGILSWWYGAGWVRRAMMTRERLASLSDYFSIGLLLRSWFAPFRQISAGRVRGPIGLQWRAFVDRSISRFIGAFVRSILIIVGIISLAVFALLGLFSLVLWLVMPLFPIIGLLLFMSGWVAGWT